MTRFIDKWLDKILQGKKSKDKKSKEELRTEKLATALIDIEIEAAKRIFATRVMIDIQSKGYQAFINEKHLDDNPFSKELNENFNWWQEGYKMAMQREALTDIQSIGYQAYCDGKSSDDNPFGKEQSENYDFAWWQYGFEQAEQAFSKQL